MNLKEKVIGSETPFKGIFFNIERHTVIQPNETEGKREFMRHPGGVAILPLTEKGEVMMVRQYRLAVDEETVEIPAGKMEFGEDPLECGKRELEEETGYTAEEMISLGYFYPSPGCLSERIYLYLAKGLKEGTLNPDEDEFLAVERIPFDTVFEKVTNSEWKDGKTTIAVMKAKALNLI